MSQKVKGWFVNKPVGKTLSDTSGCVKYITVALQVELSLTELQPEEAS